MSSKENKFPVGKKYLVNLFSFEENEFKKNTSKLNKYKLDIEFLGYSLSCLCQIATCYPKCRGGDHILEALAGRTHNLGSASFRLINYGYYDESLNLSRSIAEIANLTMLFIVQPKHYKSWVKGNKNERLKYFSPSSIRRILNKNKIPYPIDNEFYQKLCEEVTHPTPGTKPNAHSENKSVSGYVGGVFQETGYIKSLDDLSFVVTAAAFNFSKIFDRIEMLNEIQSYLDKIIEQKTQEENNKK